MKWKTPFLFLALPILGATAMSAQGPEDAPPILINNGAIITVNNATELEVRGPILNLGEGFMIINGVVRVHDFVTNDGNTDFSTGNGAMIFAGVDFQTIQGSHPSTFPNLIVSKPGNFLTLNQDITVEGNLLLNEGGLDLNGHMISLSPSSQLMGEDDTKYIFGSTGAIAISLPLNAPSNLNVANLGAVITTDANLGVTTLLRSHEIQTGNGFESIERFYDIAPANISALNATLEFHYMDHELNGQVEDKFVLYRSVDNGNTWQWGGGTVNPGANYVVLSGITGFSRWTVANKDTNPISGLEETLAGRTNIFSVFPNPAQAGNAITLGLIDAGDYWLEVIDGQGKVVTLNPFSSLGQSDLIELQPELQTPGTWYLLIRERNAGQRIYAATSIIIQ